MTRLYLNVLTVWARFDIRIVRVKLHHFFLFVAANWLLIKQITTDVYDMDLQYLCLTFHHTILLLNVQTGSKLPKMG